MPFSRHYEYLTSVPPCPLGRIGQGRGGGNHLEVCILVISNDSITSFESYPIVERRHNIKSKMASEVRQENLHQEIHGKKRSREGDAEIHQIEELSQYEIDVSFAVSIKFDILGTRHIYQRQIHLP